MFTFSSAHTWLFYPKSSAEKKWQIVHLPNFGWPLLSKKKDRRRKRRTFPPWYGVHHHIFWFHFHFLNCSNGELEVRLLFLATKDFPAIFDLQDNFPLQFFKTSTVKLGEKNKWTSSIIICIPFCMLFNKKPKFCEILRKTYSELCYH